MCPFRQTRNAGASAAVEEEDRLLLPLERLTERVAQLLGEERARVAHVDDLDLGQVVPRHRTGGAIGLRHHAHAPRQVDALEVALRGCVPALGIRRRRAVHDGRPRQLAETRRSRACVVARRRIELLVRPLVRLVDDDQPEVRLRREDRGA